MVINHFITQNFELQYIILFMVIHTVNSNTLLIKYNSYCLYVFPIDFFGFLNECTSEIWF